jgi:hypothetical protein
MVKTLGTATSVGQRDATSFLIFQPTSAAATLQQCVAGMFFDGTQRTMMQENR